MSWRALGLALAVMPFVTAAGARGKPESAASAWIGTFEPTQPSPPCGDCKTPKVVPRAGAVRVLTPSEGAAPSAGDVVIVSPLLGVIARGRIDAGRVAVAWFNYDLRDSNDGVLVLPSSAVPRLVEPAALDVAGIKQALLRNEVLSNVKKALAGIEVGAVDVDGDGKADLAVTYGCNTWADGVCQSHGQFFLARRGVKWVEID